MLFLANTLGVVSSTSELVAQCPRDGWRHLPSVAKSAQRLVPLVAFGDCRPSAAAAAPHAFVEAVLPFLRGQAQQV